MAETKLAVGDFVTIALYFAAVLAAGLYVSVFCSFSLSLFYLSIIII